MHRLSCWGGGGAAAALVHRQVAAFIHAVCLLLHALHQARPSPLLRDLCLPLPCSAFWWSSSSPSTRCVDAGHAGQPGRGAGAASSGTGEAAEAGGAGRRAADKEEQSSNAWNFAYFTGIWGPSLLLSDSTSIMLHRHAAANASAHAPALSALTCSIIFQPCAHPSPTPAASLPLCRWTTPRSCSLQCRVWLAASLRWAFHGLRGLRSRLVPALCCCLATPMDWVRRLIHPCSPDALQCSAVRGGCTHTPHPLYLTLWKVCISPCRQSHDAAGGLTNSPPMPLTPQPSIKACTCTRTRARTDTHTDTHTQVSIQAIQQLRTHQEQLRARLADAATAAAAASRQQGGGSSGSSSSSSSSSSDENSSGGRSRGGDSSSNSSNGSNAGEGAHAPTLAYEHHRQPDPWRPQQFTQGACGSMCLMGRLTGPRSGGCSRRPHLQRKRQSLLWCALCQDWTAVLCAPNALLRLQALVQQQTNRRAPSSHVTHDLKRLIRILSLPSLLLQAAPRAHRAARARPGPAVLQARPCH